MESVSNTSTEMDFFSESANSFDNLLESMDEQINDLYAIVKNQNEEIEKLKIRIENLKKLISSHLTEHLNKIIDYI